MAKIYKIIAYIVDPNDRYEDAEECYKELIDGSEVYTPVPIKHQMAEFDWNDNLMINYIGCTEDDCEKYFLPK